MGNKMTKEEFKALLEKGGFTLKKEIEVGFTYIKKVTLPLDDERIFVLLVQLDSNGNPESVNLGLDTINLSCPFWVKDYEDIVWLLNHATPINPVTIIMT